MNLYKIRREHIPHGEHITQLTVYHPCNIQTSMKHIRGVNSKERIMVWKDTGFSESDSRNLSLSFKINFLSNKLSEKINYK